MNILHALAGPAADLTRIIRSTSRNSNTLFSVYNLIPAVPAASSATRFVSVPAAASTRVTAVAVAKQRICIMYIIPSCISASKLVRSRRHNARAIIITTLYTLYGFLLFTLPQRLWVTITLIIILCLLYDCTRNNTRAVQ